MSADTIAEARRCLARGWQPVKVVPRGKNPVEDAWEKIRYSESDPPRELSNGHNLGANLGDPSGGLVDVDTDTAEAVYLAARWLPETGCRFGHASKPNSHRFYVARPVPATKQYRAPGGKMLVELRSTGAQTLISPSTHKDTGEPICWDADGDPAPIAAEVLQRAVARIAAGALLVRSWPVEGSRHHAALALAGGLLRAGWQEVDARSLWSVWRRQRETMRPMTAGRMWPPR